MPVNSIRRKEVYELMPEGIITTRKWLMERNLSRHAIDNLIKSKQLELLSNGIYVRNASKISWQSVIYTLQEILQTDLIIGGITALELQGFSHYLSFSEKKVIHLFGNDEAPEWINGVIPQTTFIKHSLTSLFGKITADPLDSKNKSLAHNFTVEKDWDEGMKKIIASSPERAYMEILLDVPKKVSFEHADQLMQGMTTLSPRSLQKLLELCQNVKVKRLFLWFADRQNYVWLDKINRGNITLGSGNRMLIKGGKLDNKYKITVPEWL